jgi:alpha-glucosidase
MRRRLDEPHHDGSVLHLPDPVPTLGGSCTTFVRVPHGADVVELHGRAVADAEPHFAAGVVDRRDEHETWWRVEIPVGNPLTGYRFLMRGARGTYRWLTGTGVVVRDPTDAHDFRVATAPPPPAWLARSVFYEVFLDRFATSDRPKPWPGWGLPSAWDDPVDQAHGAAMRQLYGGDLPGLGARLDHVSGLGANALYLTPFFPARSNHRYDASSFDVVDPLLGGDAALTALVDAVHRRGMRVLGDLTANHCGDAHPWFLRARADPYSPEARFFTFDRRHDGYACWMGEPSLPKLSHRSAELRRRLYDGSGSVVARWLRPPFDLDGWRVDVANMAARQGRHDDNHRLATTMRRTMAATKDGTYLLAEHCHDASGDLRGDGWHGTMSQAGFTRPLWRWLGHGTFPHGFLGMPGAVAPLSGADVVATLDDFRAAIPWRSAAASLIQLGSHDTPRWHSVARSRDLALVGLGVLMAYVGVPCVFYGDELGLEGADSEAARRPMPWDETRWDRALLESYRVLIGLRRSSVALQEGGLRWAHVGDDVLTWLREAPTERVLVHAARASHPSVRLPASALALSEGREAEPLTGGSPALRADGAHVSLPADGPAFHAWRLPR